MWMVFEMIQKAAQSDAPVIIVRHFRLDDGATCAALPLGVTECVDAFSGYYAAAP